MFIRRIGRDLERDGAAIGMPDQMDRPIGLIERRAQTFDFLRQRQRQVERAGLTAIADQIRRDQLCAGPSSAPSFAHWRPEPSEQCNATTQAVAVLREDT